MTAIFNTGALLKEQTFQGIIKVKAVDKSGNERIMQYVSDIPKISTEPFPSWIAVLSLIVIGIIILIKFKILKKK
jgi:hypothetical protein